MLLLVVAACSPPPPASASFSDAARASFARFEGDDESLAEAVGALLDKVDEETDLSASSYTDRSLTPEPLTEDDIVGIAEHPDEDPADGLPVAVAYASPYPPSDHAKILRLADQSPVEPNSPDEGDYDRTFTEGEDCWPDSCAFLRTDNDVIKRAEPLYTVSFSLYKDFRALPLGDGREAWVARGWLPRSATADNEAMSIDENYGLEVFADDGAGGTTRVQVLWAKSTFESDAITDDLIATVTASGIDAGFGAYDDWLADNG